MFASRCSHRGIRSERARRAPSADVSSAARRSKLDRFSLDAHRKRLRGTSGRARRPGARLTFPSSSASRRRTSSSTRSRSGRRHRAPIRRDITLAHVVLRWASACSRAATPPWPPCATPNDVFWRGGRVNWMTCAPFFTGLSIRKDKNIRKLKLSAYPKDWPIL